MSMGDNFYKGFIRIMVKNKVEFLIVGAYAVNVHGYQRNTGDLDIWTNPTYENWDKLIKSIEEFGYDTSDLTIERLINNQVLDLKEAGFKIEILQKIALAPSMRLFPEVKK